MAGTVKKLQFSEGTDVGAPTDLGLASSTITISAFADDSAYVTSKGSAAAAGDTYVNTTSKTLRSYVGGAWRNMFVEADPSDATKLVVKDLSGQTTGTTLTIASVITANRTVTYPDIAGTVAVWNSNALAIPSAANGSIAANIGANNFTIGGSSTTVIIPGNLTVQGTTTQVDTTNLNVKDANILLNDGGNDASAEGAGLTIERTGTNGAIKYEDALASKFKAGAVGAEVEIVNISGSQVLTNKDIDGGTASNTRRITLPKASSATLSGLTRKQGTIAYDTTLNEPVFDDGSTLLSFGGGGGSLSANIRASEGAGTTTLTSGDNYYQVFNLSANRTLVLPSSGIAQGAVFTIVNRSAFNLEIQADDNSVITTLAYGHVTLITLSSAPATNTDWKLSEYNAAGTVSNPTATAGTRISTVATGEFHFTRVNDRVTFDGQTSFTVSPAGDWDFTIALPSWASSNFTSNQDCNGTGITDYGGLSGAAIRANTSTDTIEVFGTSGGGAATARITGGYIVK